MRWIIDGILKIYLDTCCYGRPWDGQDQSSIIAEADAIETIIDWRHINGYIIIGSPVLDLEISKNPNAKDRNAIMSFYREAMDGNAYLTAADRARAQAFQAAGLKVNDSYHLAIAEAAGVDVLLTVDKPFLRIVNSKNICKVKVMNPLDFVSNFYYSDGAGG
ncbi:hypothetical protein R80B4_03218 [Fibrobacteres bacterium R8-0-B4]